MAHDHAYGVHLHHADSDIRTVVRCRAAGHSALVISLQDDSKTRLLARDSLIFFGFLQGGVAMGAR